MAELKEFASSISIVVSSCDAFFDAWRPFAIFFRRFWPDCPFPVYLITNEMRVRSALLRHIATGPDRGWSSNLRRAVETLSTSHLLYLQEDYFLKEPVLTDRLAGDVRYAFSEDVDSLCFRARTNVENGFVRLNDRFGMVPRDSDGRTRCQATLWKRDALLSILREGESAWDFEARGSDRTRHMRVLSYHTRDAAPVQYVMSAISRGLWMPEALGLCDQCGVKLVHRFRPAHSNNAFLRRLRKARGRRALNRELRKHRGSMLALEDEQPGS